MFLRSRPPTLADVARQAGYDLLTHSTQQTGPARRRLGEHNTDRLLISTDNLAPEELRRLHDRQFPMVLLHQTPPGSLNNPGLIASVGFDDEAVAAIQQLLSEGQDFDTVFAGDDDAAIGGLHTLKAAGRLVPLGVAVVGFDDIPSADDCPPAGKPPGERPGGGADSDAH